MHNRFWKNSGADGEIMAGVNELEIRLFKLQTGAVSGAFKLSGTFGRQFGDDDAGDLAEPESDPAECARFARKLLAMFDGGRPPGAMT